MKQEQTMNDQASGEGATAQPGDWISVANQLPDDLQRVIFVHPVDNVVVRGRFLGRIGKFWEDGDDGEEYHAAQIKWWMPETPLPEPPAKGTDR